MQTWKVLALLAVVALTCVASVAADSDDDDLQSLLDLSYGGEPAEGETEDASLATTFSDYVDEPEVETAEERKEDDAVHSVSSAAAMMDVEMKTALDKLKIFQVDKCEGDVGEMEKRDAEEAKRVKKEMTMVTMVRSELKNLNEVGEEPKKNGAKPDEGTLDIALKKHKSSLVSKLLSQLDLGRDYEEVNGANGIFKLLDKLENRLKGELAAFVAETKENHEHCVGMCKTEVKLNRKSLIKARKELRKAIDHREDMQRILAEHKGFLQMEKKDLKDHQKLHAKEDKVRQKELAILDVLYRKCKKLIAIKGSNKGVIETSDFETMIDDIDTAGITESLSEVMLEMQGLAKDAEADADGRKHPRALRVQTLLEELKKKILEERAESLKTMAELEDKVRARQAKIAEFVEKTKAAKTAEKNAREHAKERKHKLQGMYVTCRKFYTKTVKDAGLV